MNTALEWNEFLFCNGEPFCREDDWKTPNTYSANYGHPSGKSGVYCFVVYTSHEDRGNVVYIGSSKSIETRYRGHAVKAALYQDYWYVRFYFKELENYKQVERELILRFKPKFNIQHKGSRSLNCRQRSSISVQ